MYKSKSANNISIKYVSLGLSAVLLLVFYGIIIKNFPVIIWSFGEIISFTVMIYMKIHYKNKQANKSIQNNINSNNINPV